MFGLLNEAEQKNSMDPADYAAKRGRFYLIWNCVKNSGRPMLIALMAGRAAHDVETTDTSVLLEEIMQRLEKTFTPQHVPTPVEVIVTRWKRDPFSRGTFSFVGPQTNPGDYDVMAAPVGNLHFAGEATCGTHPATVHGAYLSGLRAAADVVESMIGDIGVPVPLVLPKVPTVAGADVLRRPLYASVAASPTIKIKRSGMSNKLPMKLPSSPANTTATPHINPYRSSHNSRTIQDEEYEAAIIGAILTEIGERPVKPGRPGVNPFILFSNDAWPKLKVEMGSKATRTEILAEIGRQWRTASEEVRRPYVERCAVAQRSADEARSRYEVEAAQWDDNAERIRLSYVKANPPANVSSVWTAGTSIEMPPSRRKQAINYTELTDGE